MTRHSQRLSYLLLVVLVGITYANSLTGDFLFDDLGCIPLNASIRDLSHLDEVLFYEPLGGRTVDGRPLVNFSLAVNYSISGLHTWSYHLANLVIHSCNVLLVFCLLQRAFQSPRFASVLPLNGKFIAFGIALLWGCHPLTTNAVSYIIQRAESFASLWILLGMVLFQHVIEDVQALSKSKFPILLLVVAFLGGTTKETTAVLPLLMLIYWWVMHAESKVQVREVATLIGLVAFCNWLPVGWLNLINNARGETAGATGLITPWIYLMNQGWYILKYLQLTMIPWPIAFDYGTQPLPVNWPLMVCSSLVGGMLCGSIWATYRRSLLGLCLLSGFMLLGPSSSFIPVQTQIAAEHRAYLASLLWLTLLVVSLLRLLGWFKVFERPQGRQSVAVCSLLVLLSCMVMTWNRNLVFASNLTLWTSVLENCPNNARAMSNLSKYYNEQGLESGNREYFYHACQLADHATQLSPLSDHAWLMLGIAQQGIGQTGEARKSYEQSIAIHPTKTAYLKIVELSLPNHPQAAVSWYEQALTQWPEDPQWHLRLGKLKMQNGLSLDQAEQHFLEAIRLNAEEYWAYNNLAVLYASQGKGPQAAEVLQRCLQRNPQFEPALKTARALGLLP